MVRLFTCFLLFPAMLLPSGVCVCHAEIAGPSAGEHHCKDACDVDLRGHCRPDHAPCDNPNHHGPGCPSAVAQADGLVHQPGDLSLCVTLAVQAPSLDAPTLNCTHLATDALPPPDCEPPQLYLIHLALRI